MFSRKCSGLIEGALPLFTELPRRRVFSERGLPVLMILGNAKPRLKER
jgi:hypothetical protein